MKRSISGVDIFGIIEITIGLVTFCAVVFSLLVGFSAKPLPVLIFVLTSAGISIGLGIGIILRWLRSYRLLLYFATTITLSKFLILAKIVSLNGALETSVPAPLKDIISIIYHLAAILYFTTPSVKKEFAH